MNTLKKLSQESVDQIIGVFEEHGYSVKYNPEYSEWTVRSPKNVRYARVDDRYEKGIQKFVVVTTSTILSEHEDVLRFNKELSDAAYMAGIANNILIKAQAQVGE